MAQAQKCSLVQAKRGEDESYKPLVLGPALYLNTLPEVDESILRWRSSLRTAGDRYRI